MSRSQIEELKVIRAIVADTPADKIDMDGIDGRGGCGCALYHHERITGRSSGIYLPRDLGQFLFSTYSPGAYSPATGQPAKDEFLRRVDLVIEGLEQ